MLNTFKEIQETFSATKFQDFLQSKPSDFVGLVKTHLNKNEITTSRAYINEICIGAKTANSVLGYKIKNAIIETAYSLQPSLKTEQLKTA